MAGFLLDAGSERRSLKAAIEKMGSDLNARIDQTNTRIDQTIMNMATKQDITELRANIHRVDDKLDAAFASYMVFSQ